MHIPDGFLTTPVIVGTYAISGGTLWSVRKKVSEQFREQTTVKLAMLAAFIFVAQMINIPISGGTSGHLLGGFLAALFVGPYPAMFIMSLVLTVQMLIFQDGGLTALGANILNMGIVGAGGGYLIFLFLNKIGLNGERSPFMESVAVFIAAWFSVELGALLCGLELGLSGLAGVKLTMGIMGSVHALIGLLEGVMTMFIYRAIQSLRPDLIYANSLNR
jgi:cobalt/nickel transport system permease protein